VPESSVSNLATILYQIVSNIPPQQVVQIIQAILTNQFLHSMVSQGIASKSSENTSPNNNNNNQSNNNNNTVPKSTQTPTEPLFNTEFNPNTTFDPQTKFDPFSIIQTMLSQPVQSASSNSTSTSTQTSPNANEKQSQTTTTTSNQNSFDPFSMLSNILSQPVTSTSISTSTSTSSQEPKIQNEPKETQPKQNNINLEKYVKEQQQLQDPKIIQLIDMGFADVEKNKILLAKHKGNVSDVITELLIEK